MSHCLKFLPFLCPLFILSIPARLFCLPLIPSFNFCPTLLHIPSIRLFLLFLFFSSSHLSLLLYIRFSLSLPSLSLVIISALPNYQLFSPSYLSLLLFSSLSTPSSSFPFSSPLSYRPSSFPLSPSYPPPPVPSPSFSLLFSQNFHPFPLPTTSPQGPAAITWHHLESLDASPCHMARVTRCRQGNIAIW